MKKYDYEVKTAPAVEPVTLQEVKDHLNLYHNEDDSQLTYLIESSRIGMEEATGRAYVTQTRTLRLSCFPSGNRMDLPGDPVASITHIKYYDTGGTQQIWSSAEYSLRQGGPSWVQLGYDYTWPSHRSSQDEIEIEYICGQAVTAVDGRIKHALKLRVELDYAERRDKEWDRAKESFDALQMQLMIGEEFLTYGS